MQQIIDTESTKTTKAVNMLSSNELKNQHYYPFLIQSIGHENFSVLPLAGDASNRRYFRIASDEKSWVLMVWEAFVDNNKYPFLSVLNHFAANKVNVPSVVAKAPELGLILLEDLGDLTLERKFWESQDQNLALPYYKMAIDELINIHYTATLNKADCTAFDIEFNVEKFTWELNYAKTHLLEGIAKQKFTDVEIKTLDKAFYKIAKELHDEPKFISHRDYHSRNVMLKLNKLKVIDFQDARLGPVQYDLVSLFKDSYVDLNEKMIQTLMFYYLERRKEFIKQDVDLAHFQYIYELQSVQRCFKACGSFASFWMMRKDTRYLKYLSPTLERVQKSLSHFSELKDFSDILQNAGVYEIDYNNL